MVVRDDEINSLKRSFKFDLEGIYYIFIIEVYYCLELLFN